MSEWQCTGEPQTMALYWPLRAEGFTRTEAAWKVLAILERELSPREAESFLVLKQSAQESKHPDVPFQLLNVLRRLQQGAKSETLWKYAAPLEVPWEPYRTDRKLLSAGA